MFSSRLATAVHILLYIEEYEQEEKITSEVLADSTGVNAVNIRKILALLRQAKMITVKKGVGGTYLLMKPQDITLRGIFDAVEEHESQLFRIHEHPNTDCPVGRSIASVLEGRLNPIRAEMLAEMEHVTLADLFEDMKNQLGKEVK